jgi:DNA-binding LacI/PurR family transcriptional regulator
VNETEEPPARDFKPAVTIKDIARVAGVSQSTVSRILNESPVSIPVSAKTRERVMAAAKEFGYRPNPLARALRGAPTMLLGAIVRDITDPFFAAVIDVIARSAKARGYSVVLGHAQARADEALELAAVLEARHCDAVLLIGDFHEQPRLIDDLKGGAAPVVALWHGSRDDGFHSVRVDNAAGVTAALDHLAELGHTRVALVAGASLGDVRERVDAYRASSGATGRTLPEEYVQHVANDFEAAAAALDAIMGATERPTAIVATTDVLAIGVLAAAAARGIRVPDELSVVGFDDIPFAAATVPPLTTVRMPVAEMGEAAVALAVSAANVAPEKHVFEPALVVRASTARARCSRSAVARGPGHADEIGGARAVDPARDRAEPCR